MIPTYNGYQDYSQSEIYVFRGDLLLVKKSENIQIGDTIVFDVEGYSIPIVHRVVDIIKTPDGIFYRTKGDNNPSIDRWIVSAEDIHGVVIFRIPYLGWLALQLQKPFLQIFLVGIFVASLAYEFVLSEEETETPQDTEHNASSTTTNKKGFDFYVTIKPLFAAKRTLLFMLLLSIFILAHFSALFTITNNVTALYPGTKEIITNNDSIAASTVLPPLPQDISNVSKLFVPIWLQITSSSLFKWIYKVEMVINTSQIAYVWKIVYSFSGTKIIKAGLLIPLSNSTKILNTQTNSFSIELTIKYYETGLFAAKKTKIAQNLIVNIKII